MPHIQGLPAGPLAIIGDIHGELAALDALLGHLDERYPDHHIVFLGDLADRGPDSPGVIRRVRERMAGGAQCVLGNHELSVMRGKDKKYNRWFFTEGGDWKPKETSGEAVPMLALPTSQRADVAAFFASLPLALERDGLRIVHACWNVDAVARVRHTDESTLEVFASGPTHNLREPAANSVNEGDGPRMRDPEWEAQEIHQQNGNAIVVLTSGVERSADPSRGDKIVWSGNQWRPLIRHRWWEDYDDNVPVVIGHYSRKWRAEHRDEKTELMFPHPEPGRPVGQRRNVYCVDYSVGTRFRERHHGETEPFAGRLAALLWDDGTPPALLFDDGELALTHGPS
jgi:hypothetical protein